MLTVARDGSGDYRTVQEAVDAISEDQDRTIVIRTGVYHERLVIYPDHVTLIGEDPDKTVITWSACAKDQDSTGKERGTFLSASVITAGKDIRMENLTIRNDAGDGRTAGQAVAAYAAGDRGIWRNCRLIAHQDTLFCGPLMPKVIADFAPYTTAAECCDSVGDCPSTYSRQYFENCYIQGDIDFIFGPYRCWFEKCTLFMNRRGGYYTAANTPQDQPHGLVFHRCTLTGECGDGDAYLGRPWRAYARTVFLECRMGRQVAPAGFSDWDEKRVVTERYAEYNSSGEGARITARHPGQRILTGEEAKTITTDAVLGGNDGWHPEGITDIPLLFQ